MLTTPPPLPGRAKIRLVHILLAINLGILGAHDFYSGRHSRGFMKLGLLGACLIGMAVLHFANPPATFWPWVTACQAVLFTLEAWSLVDAVRHTDDAAGIPMA